MKKQTYIRIFLVIIFFMMFLLNMLTPILADDYSYYTGINGVKINGILDIVEFQINHYLTWGGRTVAHSLAQILLQFPKIIFNILNSVMYTLLVFLIYKISKNGNKDKPLLLICIHLLLWTFLPVFGQSTIWLVGSCNYLWTSVFILFLIYLVINNKLSNKPVMLFLYLLLGIISGWTNENTAFGLIVCLISVLIIQKIVYKSKINISQIFCLCGAILGFIIMIVAPGNYVRKELLEENVSFISKILSRFIDCTNGVYLYLTPMIIILIIIFSIYFYKKKNVKDKNILMSFVFFISAFFSVYSMVLSPTFPERAWSGIIIYLTISIISVIFLYEERIFKFIILDIVVISSIFYVRDYSLLVKEMIQMEKFYEDRENYILEEKQNGNLDIVTKVYYPVSKRNPGYGLSDIGYNASDWPNDDIANYYGINSIVGDSND